jgi:hypothetical protein
MTSTPLRIHTRHPSGSENRFCRRTEIYRCRVFDKSLVHKAATEVIGHARDLVAPTALLTFAECHTRLDLVVLQARQQLLRQCRGSRQHAHLFEYYELWRGLVVFIFDDGAEAICVLAVRVNTAIVFRVYSCPELLIEEATWASWQGVSVRV